MSVCCRVGIIPDSYSVGPVFEFRPEIFCPDRAPSRFSSFSAVEFSDGTSSGVPRNFFRGGGVQQIQLRTEDREDGDLGAVAP